METVIDAISVATAWLFFLFQKAKQQRFCPIVKQSRVKAEK